MFPSGDINSDLNHSSMPKISYCMSAGANLLIICEFEFIYRNHVVDDPAY